MRAFYRVSGNVRIDLSPGDVMQVRSDPYTTSVVASRESFDELAAQIRDGDVEKAGLKRELEMTRSSLAVARDDLARMTEELDVLRRWDQVRPTKTVITIAGQDTVGPTHWATEAELLAEATTKLKELEATVVRQANEITRLTGESE